VPPNLPQNHLKIYTMPGFCGGAERQSNPDPTGHMRREITTEPPAQLPHPSPTARREIVDRWGFVTSWEERELRQARSTASRI
jgi:hypothetical protein